MRALAQGQTGEDGVLGSTMGSSTDVRGDASPPAYCASVLSTRNSASFHANEYFMPCMLQHVRVFFVCSQVIRPNCRNSTQNIRFSFRLLPGVATCIRDVFITQLLHDGLV